MTPRFGDCRLSSFSSAQFSLQERLQRVNWFLLSSWESSPSLASITHLSSSYLHEILVLIRDRKSVLMTQNWIRDRLYVYVSLRTPWKWCQVFYRSQTRRWFSCSASEFKRHITTMIILCTGDQSRVNYGDWNLSFFFFFFNACHGTLHVLCMAKVGTEGIARLVSKVWITCLDNLMRGCHVDYRRHTYPSSSCAHFRHVLECFFFLARCLVAD